MIRSLRLVLGLGLGFELFSDFSRDKMTSYQCGGWKQVLTGKASRKNQAENPPSLRVCITDGLHELSHHERVFSGFFFFAVSIGR